MPRWAVVSATMALVAFAWLIGPTASNAQIVLESRQELDFDRPESWAMKYFASISQMTGMGAPRRMEPGAVELGIEAGWIPSLSESERTVGFYGTKTEDLNKTSVFGRARVLVGLPRAFSLELGWVPPIERGGVEPNVLALSIARPVYERGNKRVGLRLTALGGTLEGDLTCSAEEAAAGDDREQNPFGCERPSEDELDVQSFSFDVSGAIDLGRFEPYLALSYNDMDLEFQIRALYSGIDDHTLQVTDGNTFSAFGGVEIESSKRSRTSVEIFYTPLDVVRERGGSKSTEDLINLRVSFRYKIR
jgi:hypothetical protein